MKEGGEEEKRRRKREQRQLKKNLNKTINPQLNGWKLLQFKKPCSPTYPHQWTNTQKIIIKWLPLKTVNTKINAIRTNLCERLLKTELSDRWQKQKKKPTAIKWRLGVSTFTNDVRSRQVSHIWYTNIWKWDSLRQERCPCRTLEACDWLQQNGKMLTAGAWYTWRT